MAIASFKIQGEKSFLFLQEKIMLQKGLEKEVRKKRKTFLSEYGILLPGVLGFVSVHDSSYSFNIGFFKLWCDYGCNLL